MTHGAGGSGDSEERSSSGDRKSSASGDREGLRPSGSRESQIPGDREERRSSSSQNSERSDDADAGPTDRARKRELALDLLAHLEDDELGLPETIDRIETVTTDPALTREILDEAELRGILDREGGRIRTRRGGTFVRFESQVVARDGEFECRRCGAAVSTGHFVRFESGELGPFGSSCVRKVTGRE